MRRFVLAVAVLLGGFSAVVVPAGMASAKPIKQAVSGPFSGTGVFDLSTPSCSFAHTVFNATYTAKSGGTGSFTLDGCAVLPTSGNAAPYSGTATLTRPDGTVLTGAFSGTVDIITGSLDLTLSLSDAGGATTIVHLTGIWTSSSQPGVPGPVSGTLSGK